MPVLTQQHPLHLRATPCEAFLVELFIAGISPDAEPVTVRYDKLACRNSLGSLRIGDHEGLPPAGGIRTSSPGAYLRVRPLTHFETKHTPKERASLPSQALIQRASVRARNSHMKNDSFHHATFLHRPALFSVSTGQNSTRQAFIG